MTSKGLIQEPPILFLPSLAKRFKDEKGIDPADAAIIMQQLHYKMEAAKESDNRYVYIDQKWWVYNSYPEWEQCFIWLNQSKIKRILNKLEDLGLIDSRQGVKSATDRRKWYTINYVNLDKYMNPDCVDLSDASVQNAPMEESKMLPSTSVQNAPIISKRENTLKEIIDSKESIREPENLTPIESPKPDKPTSNIHQLMFGAICEAFSVDPSKLTPNERSLYGKAAKQLCAAGRSPDNAKTIYDYCKRNFTIFSPMALTTHAAVALSDQQQPPPVEVIEVNFDIESTIDLNGAVNHDH